MFTSFICGNKKEVALHVPVITYKMTSQFLLIKLFRN